MNDTVERRILFIENNFTYRSPRPDNRLHGGATTVQQIGAITDSLERTAGRYLESIGAYAEVLLAACPVSNGKVTITEGMITDSLKAQNYRSLAARWGDDNGVGIAVGISIPIFGQDWEVAIALTQKGKWQFLPVLDAEAEARYHLPIHRSRLREDLNLGAQRAS